MKISTTLLFTTAFTFAVPHATSNQHLNTNPAICSLILTLRLYINDLNTYPTQRDIYMAQARAFTLDDELQCPAPNGILNTEEATSDACKKNQAIKDVLDQLRFSSSEDKRLRLRALDAACLELDEMVGCSIK